MTPGEIKARLDDHDQRIAALESNHKDMSKAVDEIKKDTSEIVTLLRDMKGAWRILDLAAKAVKPVAWLGGMALAAGAFWTHLKGLR